MEVIRDTNLETPLINGNRESMELEQLSVETNADEPFWLKVLYFLGGVYPILRENGKCKCTWKTVRWSIVPFVIVWSIVMLVIVIVVNLSFSSNVNMGLPKKLYSSTFQKFWVVLGSLLYLLLSLSLSYTRKRFSDAIVGEENRLYINTVAKRGVMLSLIGGVIGGVICGVDGALDGVLDGVSSPVVYVSVVINVFVSVTLLFVIILRCLFLAHTGVAQVKTELLEMVRGTEVEEVQTKLLKISKMIQEASVGYLQVPLSLFFVLGMVVVVEAGIRTYKHPQKYMFYSDIISLVFFGTAIVTPLWLLTRIEKFYLWTLRELLHRNTVMPRTDRTYLLSNYDTIAPRASIFGIYITRGRVASIIIAIFGSIAPKIGIYVYENLGY